MTGTGNNTYLCSGIGKSGNRGASLIDAGVGAPEHIEAIAAALKGEPLERVIVTHGHADHSSGVPALRARWPQLQASKHFPDADPADGWSALADGDVIDIGTGRLRVLVTPGHALDHICLFDDISGDLFVGDMVVAGTTVFVPPRAKGGGLAAYLRSLVRLRDLNASRLLPGHGTVIEDPRTRITEIIDHRLMREAQVLACVKDGVTSADAIAERIYEGLADAVKPFARQTVLAHLEKLGEDGLV
jgi:ribonuclease/clavin/mitogillin